MSPKYGRPLGDKALAVMDAVRATPLTLQTLAHQLQLSYSDTQGTVKRLTAAGRLEYGELVHNTGGRPARLVQITACSAFAVGTSTGDVFAQLGNWVRGY